MEQNPKNLNKLKRCPFCGCSAAIWSEPDGYVVKCNCCGIQLCATSVESAIRAWNMRANVK